MLTPVPDLTRDQFADAGAWLEATYKARGWNRSRLAKRAGVSVAWLQTLENGGKKKGADSDEWTLPNPRADLLAKLAVAIPVDPQEIGKRYGRTVPDLRQPTEPQTPGDEVAAEVRALRSDIRALVDRLEQLLAQQPSR